MTIQTKPAGPYYAVQIKQLIEGEKDYGQWRTVKRYFGPDRLAKAEMHVAYIMEHSHSLDTQIVGH